MTVAKSSVIRLFNVLTCVVKEFRTEISEACLEYTSASSWGSRVLASVPTSVLIFIIRRSS